MTSQERKVLRMALEAFKEINYDQAYSTEITAIKEALAQPGRTWVGLTADEFKFIASKYLLSREAGLEYFQEEIEAKLKEKNT